MKKGIIAVAVISMMGVSGAFAAQTNTGCQGNCPGGDTINTTNQGGTGYGGNGGIGIGGAGGSAVGVGTGGAGGQGGQGGSVVGSGNGTGIGVGGAVVGSGNSSATGGSVKNDVKNTNTNTNVAAQQQGQKQGQSQSSNNRNNNRNDNNSNATSYGSVATTAQSTSLTVQGDTYEAPRIPVSTAYAPNIMPTAVCMGSTSMGGQGMSFGFSLGTSWTDANCMLLEQVRTVSVVLGQKEIAQEMMMSVSAYADAVKRLQDKKTGVKTAEVVREAPVYTKTKYELYGN